MQALPRHERDALAVKVAAIETAVSPAQRVDNVLNLATWLLLVPDDSADGASGGGRTSTASAYLLKSSNTDRQSVLRPLDLIFPPRTIRRDGA
jgi:hypothetical protein